MRPRGRERGSDGWLALEYFIDEKRRTNEVLRVQLLLLLRCDCYCYLSYSRAARGSLKGGERGKTEKEK